MEVTKKEKREKIQLARELISEGVKMLYSGKLNDARDTVIRARDIFAEIGEKKELASTINVLAIIYDELGYEALGLSCFLDALDIALDENAFDLASKLYNNIGSKFMHTKTYDRALFYFTKSREMLKKGQELNMVSEKDKICFMLILNLNLSLTYCINGNYDEARQCYYESVKLSQNPKNESQMLTFRSFEALILWKLGEHENAKNKMDDVLETASQLEYATNFIEVMSYIFEILRELKDYEKWEHALTIMDSRVTGEVGLLVKQEILKYWLEYYKATDNREKYAKACVDFYELTLEKEKEDNEKAANGVEMEAEMRRASREKVQTDKKVYLDSLTGIGNRHRMLVESTTYIKESIESNKSITIGLIDIDYFKECNDTYGHMAGDECLKKVASTIKESLADKGSVYRFGGDEFLVLIPDVETDEVNEIAKRIFDKLAEKKIPNEKSPVSKYVTISQGYTAAYAEEGDTIETLINRADRVLYHVKRFGRNNYKYMNLDEIDL